MNRTTMSTTLSPAIANLAAGQEASAIPAEYKDVKGIETSLAALVDGSTVTA
jgi:hypothetical protein